MTPGRLTNEALDEIVRGLDRWHVCSPDVAKTLVAEIKRLRTVLDEVWAQVDDVQDRIEKARGDRR